MNAYLLQHICDIGVSFQLLVPMSYNMVKYLILFILFVNEILSLITFYILDLGPVYWSACQPAGIH